MPAPPLTPEDIEWLQRYDRPGNIRELQNVIERAVILSKGVRLRLDVALPRITGATGEPISRPQTVAVTTSFSPTANAAIASVRM